MVINYRLPAEKCHETVIKMGLYSNFATADWYVISVNRRF